MYMETKASFKLKLFLRELLIDQTIMNELRTEDVEDFNNLCERINLLDVDECTHLLKLICAKKYEYMVSSLKFNVYHFKACLNSLSYIIY